GLVLGLDQHQAAAGLALGVEHRSPQAHVRGEPVHVFAVRWASGSADRLGFAVAAVQAIDHVEIHHASASSVGRGVVSPPLGGCTAACRYGWKSLPCVRAARRSCASRIACHTVCAVAGSEMSATPSGRSASTTAPAIAGGKPIVPVSAPPLTPSGLVPVGTGRKASLKRGKSCACGIA